MDILDIIPVESHGMSAWTLLVFAFTGTGGWFVYNLIRREIKRTNTKIDTEIKDVNSKVDLLFAKVDDTNISISDIKTHIAGMHETVKWIQKSISNTENSNNKIRESLTLITEGLLDNDQIPRRR